MAIVVTSAVTAAASGYIVTSPNDIAPDVIETQHIADGAVTHGLLSNSAVTATKIAQHQVQPQHLAWPEEWHTAGNPGEPYFDDYPDNPDYCVAETTDWEDCGWHASNADNSVQFSKDTDGIVRLRGEACFTTRSKVANVEPCFTAYASPPLTWPADEQRRMFTLPKSTGRRGP